MEGGKKEEEVERLSGKVGMVSLGWDDLGGKWSDGGGGEERRGGE